MYAEEVDWCRRMDLAGWQVWYQPMAEVIHWGGASSANRRVEREADLYRSRVRFMRKFGGPLRAALLKGMLFTTASARWAIFALQRTLLRGNPRQTPGPRRLARVLRDV